MTKLFHTIVAGALLSGSAIAAEKELSTDKEKVSYALGMSYGSSWRAQELDFDLEALMMGIRDSLQGAETRLTEEEAREVMNDFRTKVTAQREEKRRQLSAKNREAGQKFLADNASKEGVVTLPSGLQYKVISEGQGESPQATDRVKVHYRGTLIDGTEFDSSYGRGEPAVFEVGRVIRGWTEALQLMKPGAKWQLFIPTDLAYQDRGAGNKIEPGATLLFEVELLEVLPAPQAKRTEAVTSDIIKVPSAEGLQRGEQIEIIKKEDLEKLKEENESKN